MRDVSRAIEQIGEIHDQLARTEVYRGWQPVPVAASGVLGLGAAAWQSSAARPIEPWSFTFYWLAVASVALTVGCSEIVWHYFARAGSAERRRTLHVLGQFVPSLAAGIIVTGALLRLGPALVTLLPGLWALLFGVGVFAASPYVQRASRLVALYYWTAGLLLLWTAGGIDTLSPWAVGGTFGAGQVLGAFAIHFSPEPRRHDQTTL